MSVQCPPRLLCMQVNLRNVGRQKYARLDTQSDQLQVNPQLQVAVCCCCIRFINVIVGLQRCELYDSYSQATCL